MVQHPDPQKGGEEPNSSRPNLPTLGNWSALDADYGDDAPAGPEHPNQNSRAGLVGNYWNVDLNPPSEIHLRLERPVLFLWLLISGFWQGFVPWMIMALALITYAVTAYPAFRRYGWGGQSWVYGAMGLGQIILACSFITNLGPGWSFMSFYWLAVLLAWFLLEWRRLRPL